jgi:hypothetical protein
VQATNAAGAVCNPQFLFICAACVLGLEPQGGLEGGIGALGWKWWSASQHQGGPFGKRRSFVGPPHSLPWQILLDQVQTDLGAEVTTEVTAGVVTSASSRSDCRIFAAGAISVLPDYIEGLSRRWMLE